MRRANSAADTSSFSMIVSTILSMSASSTRRLIRAARAGSAIVRSRSVDPPLFFRASAAFIVFALLYRIEVRCALFDGTRNSTVSRLVALPTLFQIIVAHDPRRATFFPKGREALLAGLDCDNQRVFVLLVHARLSGPATFRNVTPVLDTGNKIVLLAHRHLLVGIEPRHGAVGAPVPLEAPVKGVMD